MIRLDADKRARISQLQAEVRKIEDPIREARRIERAKARVARERSVGKRTAGQRQPRVKEPAYLNWIRSLPCVICGKPPRSQAAHVRSGYPEAGWRPTGRSEKPDDRRTVPLCRMDHLDGPDAQHKANERAWWAERGIYPPDLCAALSAAYDAHEDGASVLSGFPKRGTR